MKCLQCSPLKFLDMLYIKQTERSAGGGQDRDNVRKQVMEGLAQEGAPPLLVFPEGGLTSGRSGLLQFHKFLFSLDYCVQPVVIRAHGGPLPINIDNNMGTTWGNILYFAFQPWQTFTVMYLPPTKRRSNEDPLDFAQRVMGLIGKEKGIDCSPFLYREKRIYTKMKNQLFGNGFRYRFVQNKAGRAGTGIHGGRVHPEGNATGFNKGGGGEEGAVVGEDGEEQFPSITIRSQCGCCCAPSLNRVSKGVDPLDYLAASIEKAFTGADGASTSRIFEVEGGGADRV